MMDKLIRLLGADPHQYKILTKTNMTIDSRISDLTTFSSFPILVAFYAILSLLISLSAFSLDSFSFTFLMMLSSMTMISFVAIIYFEDVINPNDYNVLSHIPVSSRTYFLVKLTRMFANVIILASAFNFPPSILGIWAKNRSIFFPFVYFFTSLIAAFFVTGLITSFYGYLMKLYKSDRFHDIIAYFQIIISLVFSMGFIVGPKVIPILNLGYLNNIEKTKWLYILPSGWFTGLAYLALGHIELRYLLLSAISIATNILLFILPIWRISTNYSQYLSYMDESHRSSRRIKKVHRSVFAHLFKDSEALAAFELTLKYMKRDRGTKNRIYIMLGLPIGQTILMIMNVLKYRGNPFDPTLAVILPMISFIICTYSISVTFSMIKYSEHFKGMWIIVVAPLQQFNSYFKGVRMAIIFCLITPYFLFLIIMYSFFWNIFLSMIYILPSIIGSIYYLSFYSAINPDLPFSVDPKKRKGIDNIMVMIISFFVYAIIIGTQYPVYKIHKGLYIVLYVGTILAGSILFIFQEHRNNRKVNQYAIDLQ